MNFGRGLSLVYYDLKYNRSDTSSEGLDVYVFQDAFHMQVLCP